jgi:hypothetical protein
MGTEREPRRKKLFLERVPRIEWNFMQEFHFKKWAAFSRHRRDPSTKTGKIELERAQLHCPPSLAWKERKRKS